MARRLIGTGTTNSQGIATCSPTYTGVGAGKLQIVATSGDLESAPYELMDAILYDKAVTGSVNTSAFSYNSTYITVTTSASGTSVASSDTSGFRAFAAVNPNTTSTSWTDPFVCELDINSSDTDNRFHIYTDNNNLISRTMGELGLTSGGHLKVTYDGSVASFYINNSDVPVYTTTKALSSFSIRLFMAPESTLSYKEFMVYPF